MTRRPRRGVRIFLSELDDCYPGLTDRIRNLVRDRQRQLPTAMEQRLFLISPLLWWYHRFIVRILDRLMPAARRRASARFLTRTARTLRSDIPAKQGRPNELRGSESALVRGSFAGRTWLAASRGPHDVPLRVRPLDTSLDPSTALEV